MSVATSDSVFWIAMLVQPLPRPITAGESHVRAPAFPSLGRALCWITPPFSFNLNFRTYHPPCSGSFLSSEKSFLHSGADVGVVVCTTEVRLVDCCELQASVDSQ